ncbi:pentapeptide repeat-containing protein [Microcoleus sp. herbarium12]|jgi:Pentapeptide repeats (8 copies)|uniref:pentapeptide repeat-containing protein n=1 Tax=Microcoleus sp. herbarium12 TaxID=3055437 RepID=UPI002FD72F2E
MTLDFSHQDLRGRSFVGQDLTNANFSHADIRGTDFSKAILTGANFRQAVAGMRSPWLLLFICVSLLLLMIALPTATNLMAAQLWDSKQPDYLQAEYRAKTLLGFAAPLTVLFGAILSSSVQSLLTKIVRINQARKYKQEVVVLSLCLVFVFIAIAVYYFIYDSSVAQILKTVNSGDWYARLLATMESGIQSGLFCLLAGSSCLSIMKATNFRRSLSLALSFSGLGLLVGSLIGFFLVKTRYFLSLLIVVFFPFSSMFLLSNTLSSGFSIEGCFYQASSNFFCLIALYLLYIFYICLYYTFLFLGFILGYFLYRTYNIQLVLQRFLIVLPIIILFSSLIYSVKIGFFMFHQLGQPQQTLPLNLWLWVKNLFILFAPIVLLFLCSLGISWAVAPTSFYEANLTNADFTRASLGKVILSKASLES